MGWFDFFKKKKVRQANAASANQSTPLKFEGPTLFYHEDEYCQIELVPAVNYQRLKNESEQIQQFAKKHSEGMGFNRIFVRKEGDKIPLKSLLIKPVELEKLLETMELKRVKNVLTGYGNSYRELHENCIGFGNDKAAVFYSFEDGVVTNIWISNPWNMDEKKLKVCLHVIGSKWDVLLQDWYKQDAFNLSDMADVEDYVHSYRG